jgi:MSHA biogenesis protein MshQ
MDKMTKLIRLVLILATAIVWSNGAGAATQVRSPAAAADCTSTTGVGTIAWGNPGRAISNDGNYATASVDDNQVTNYLRCLNYGFTIPAGSTINGIIVRVDRKSNNSATERDAAMRLVKAGAIGTTDRSTATIYTTADAYEAHGTATDLWGTTWSAAEINAVNFGMAFAAQKAGTAGGARTISVDHAEITVDYTPPPLVTSINRASTNPTAPATSVAWTVVFDMSVSGVDATDFALAQAGGVSGATITSVTGSGTTWTVTANSGSGGGALGLNLVDNDSIVSSAGTPLAGPGTGNGNFIGEVYSVFSCTPPSNTPAGLTLSCVCDTFGRASLNPSTIYGGSWAVSNSDGISNPYINGTTGLLRLTENTGYNAKAATVPTIFPAAGNYISVEFVNYAYNGTATGADGIAVTLSDYSIPAVPGGFGGSLGYAQRNDGAQPPGFAGGWVGVALDEYGNYQNPNEGRVGGPGFVAQSVGVRGPGNGANGYRWMGGTASNPGGVGIDNSGSATPAPGHMFQVIVDARSYSSGTINVNVNRDATTKNGSTYTSLFGPFNAYNEANYALSQGWITKLVPDYWKVSFTGSTGGSTNIHEIGSLRICAQTVYPATGGSASGFSAIDEAYPAAAGSTVPAYPNFSTGDIYMKLAGTPFKLWVAALTGTGISSAYSAVSNKFLQVKMVDNSDNACGSDSARTCNAACANKAAVEAGASQSMTMTSADPGAKLSADFTLNSSYKNLISVIKECTTAACTAFTATAPACSVDSFSVRPTSIATLVSSNATNATSSGNPIFKAGSGNFTLTATTTGVAGSPSGYTGVLKINNTAVQAIGAAGNVAGKIAPTTFPAATSATGSSTASGTTFTYSEVGAFRLAGYVPGTAGQDTLPRGVYDGVDTASECTAPGLTGPLCDALRTASWTGVDSISTKSDCILDSYSNVKVGGKYGCSFGNVASTATIGRFVPDHFDTFVTGGTACPTALTCPCAIGAICPPTVSNGFVYSGQAFTTNVIARNAAGATTTNYDSARGYSKAATLSAWDATGSTTTQNPPAGATGAFAAGTTAIPASAFNLGTTITGMPAMPNYSLPNIYPSATPPPAPTNIFMRAIDADNMTSLRGAASVENGIKIISGRIAMTNAHGSELQQLPVGVTAQYWNGARYVTSDTHSFSIPNASVVFSNCMKNLLAGSACKPAPILEIAPTTPPGPIVMTNGTGAFTLKAPGAGNYGSADMSINLFSYLPSTTNRATFGIYKAGPIIYIRELY